MSYRMFPMALALGVVLLNLPLAGCGAAPDTPASFEGGNEGNPLDGAVIRNDGQDIVLQLNDDGTALESVTIAADRIEFDTDVSLEQGVLAPREIISGENSLTINRTFNTATVSVPQFGSVQVPLDEIEVDPFGTGMNLRDANQSEGDCENIVAGADDFCSQFLANGASAEQEVVDLALQVAMENDIPSILFPTVENIIRQFYDVLRNFCTGWTEVRSSTPPLDPCM